MGDFLLGGETSGTPMETRGGTTQLAMLFQELMGGGGAGGRGGLGGVNDEFSRLGNEALLSLLGAIGGEGALREGLMSPSDRTSGLFASLRPFEARETGRQVSGLRNQFGTLGGRFSRNVGTAEGELRSGLSEGFMRTREEALLNAEGQRQNFLTNLLQLGLGAKQGALAPFQLMSQFFAPGAPQFQQGALGELLGAAGTAAGFLAGGAPAAAGAAGGGTRPNPFPRKF